MNLQDVVADRQAIFSATANALKARLIRARCFCFALSIVGAALAAIAGGLANVDYRSLMAWPAAAMLAIGAFVAARLLGRESVMLHVQARLASEALKREAFLYATLAPPYAVAQPQRDALFNAALGAMEKGAEGLCLHEQKAQGSGSCPRVLLSAQTYLNERVIGQINYYRKSADALYAPSRLLHGMEFVLAGIAAVVTAIAASLGKGRFDLASLTAVVTTLAGTVLAHLQASRYDECIISYRATAHRLANLAAMIPAGATAADIALAAEEIIAAETRSWQALWLGEKK